MIAKNRVFSENGDPSLAERQEAEQFMRAARALFSWRALCILAWVLHAALLLACTCGTISAIREEAAHARLAAQHRPPEGK